MRLVTTLGLMAAVLTALGMGMIRPVRADGVDDYIKTEMAKRHIPGLSVAVLKDGKIVKAQGYGLANVELNVPATADTIYPLGSISKQFTAVGIMLLAQEGKVALDDPISKYLTSLPETWQGVTVRELLNQTSGIPEWNPDTDKDPLLKDYPLAEIARRAAVKPLAFKPGTKYEYSNTNFSLLAGIIEKAGGKPYGDFLQDRLFKPLDMEATGVYDPQIIVRNRSMGYDLVQGEVYNNIILFDPSYYAGAGGLQSTVGDLVKWDAAVAAGRVLPLPVMSQMWTPPTLPGGAKTNYGMGWVSQTVNGRRFIWHNGAIPGGTGFLGRFPDDHLTVVILSNLFRFGGQGESHSFLPLGQGLAAFYVPALTPVKAAALADDPAVTQLLHAIITGLAAGKADPARFTPAMYAVWTPAVLAQTQASIAPAGPLQSLTLLSRATESGLRVYRYRAVFSANAAVFTLALTPNGKIAVLSFAAG